MKYIFKLILYLSISYIIFVVLTTIGEYYYANYKCTCPPWPHQESLSWLFERRLYETLSFIIPHSVGGFFAWQSLKKAPVKAMVIWAVFPPLIFSLIYVAMEFIKIDSSEFALSLSLIGWPLGIVAISFYSLNFLSNKN